MNRVDVECPECGETTSQVMYDGETREDVARLVAQKCRAWNAFVEKWRERSEKEAVR